MNEDELKQNFIELLEILCEGVHEPAGRNCGYGFRLDSQELAFERFKEMVNTNN